jgi:hypothetical protein
MKTRIVHASQTLWHSKDIVGIVSCKVLPDELLYRAIETFYYSSRLVTIGREVVDILVLWKTQ